MSYQKTNDSTSQIVNVISVNGIGISEADVAQELQYHPAESADDAIHRASEALIIRQVLLQKSLSLGIDGAVGQNDSETVDESAIRQLLEQEIEIKTVSDQECKRYYQSNLKKFVSAPLMEVAHILLAADPKDFSERQSVREKAEELISKIESGEEFSVLVQLHSACPSNKEGGNLGQISKGQTVPEFERQLFLLDEGLAKSPIESRYGCHVVLVQKKVEGVQLPFEDCKGKIAQYLENQSYSRSVSQYISILIDEADIGGFDTAVNGTPLVQ